MVPIDLNRSPTQNLCSHSLWSVNHLVFDAIISSRREIGKRDSQGGDFCPLLLIHIIEILSSIQDDV